MAVASLVLGVGILVFWAISLWSGELSRGNEPWAGHRRHETSFIVPDVVLALALILSAALSDLAPDASARLRHMSAGALVFLGIMDLAYLKLTWKDRTRAMRFRTAAVAGVVLVAGGALSIPE